MKQQTHHSAFSLIEVIFVLLILGIISSIGSSILVQVYESYITQNALYKVNTKTELAANQIVNRLNFRVLGTSISKDINNNGYVEGTHWIQLRDIQPVANSFTTIEWIGYDNDSFSANTKPGWSGMANYSTATTEQFFTPGSDLSYSREIIYNLSNKDIDIDTETGNSAAVLFFETENRYNGTDEYDPSCMGLVDPSNTNCIFNVARDNNSTLKFIGTDKGTPKIITERYKLAWSAYALVPKENTSGLNDLYLHYNYQPWNGEAYNDEETSTRLLIKNVSVFKFTENGGVLQFKICVQENIGQDFNISTCKEKVVL